MRVVTSAEIAEMDRRATENHGIPVAQLMDTAGRRVAQAAELLLRERGGRRVVVLAGKGNNGGDGLVAARHLDRKSTRLNPVTWPSRMPSSA